MNIHAPRHFVPPRPDIPKESVSWYGFLRALRTNALQIWPQDAYTKDVLEQSFFRRKRFLLNAPDAIHHVLVDNIENYRRTRATIRILRPITGEGLFLSEGDEWRHQRRTIAPTLAPRVIPMLARHIVEVADVALARLDAAAARPIDMLAAMQFLALEVAARSMFSLEMDRYGPALRRMIKSFSADLGRPYFLDLMLPVGIPSPRDFARMRFRRRWIALMDEVLAARQREPASDQPRDLFDVLLAARDPETGAAFSQAQLRDQMATMIVAGHETTALTMFWSLYLLASAPTEQSLVAQEVADVDLTIENAGAALAKLPYTRAVVSEVAAALSARRRDCARLGGRRRHRRGKNSRGLARHDLALGTAPPCQAVERARGLRPLAVPRGQAAGASLRLSALRRRPARLRRRAVRACRGRAGAREDDAALRDFVSRR